MHKVQFTAGLSNGQTIAEGTGNFQVIEGAPSPWQRLLAYLGENQVEITSLGLYTRDGKRWTLPSAGKNPKFHALQQARVPVSYRFFRKAAGDVTVAGKNTLDELYAVVEATYDDGTLLQIWVNEVDPTKSWSIVL